MRGERESVMKATRDEVRDGWTMEAPGWVKHASLIETWTRPTVDVVLDGARIGAGASVVDVACGSGNVAFAAAARAGPRGSVVGVDIVPEMVRGAESIARARGITNVAFRTGDAEALAFPDRSVDAVTCMHGLMFVPDAVQAAREIRRILRPGKRASVLVWGPREGNPFLTTVVGPFFQRMREAPEEPEDAPTPFRFAAAGRLGAVLRAGGFERVEERVVEVPWEFPGDAKRFMATVPEISSSLFAWFRSALSREDYEAATRELAAAAKEREDGARVRFTATMVLATGERGAAP